MSLKVIEVRAVAVDLGGDVMPRPMGETTPQTQLRESPPAKHRRPPTPAIGRPAENAACTLEIAASRASRTVSKTSRSRSEGSRPTTTPSR